MSTCAHCVDPCLMGHRHVPLKEILLLSTPLIADRWETSLCNAEVWDKCAEVSKGLHSSFSIGLDAYKLVKTFSPANHYKHYFQVSSRNQAQPWITFEQGSIAKHKLDRRVLTITAGIDVCSPVILKGEDGMHYVSEHIDAGVHSRDATLIHPPQDLNPKTVCQIEEACQN